MFGLLTAPLRCLVALPFPPSSIYHKITKPGVPLIVPALECDFETGAVWKRGGGALVWEEEKAAKEELKREKGNLGAAWSRVKESLY